MNIKQLGVWMSGVLLAGAVTEGAEITYKLTDLADFPEFSVKNEGQEFKGSGFVGLYNEVGAGSDQFVHLFGLQKSEYSRTEMQVDLSPLAGATILGAKLTFDLRDGTATKQTAVLTAFKSDGLLRYDWEAPNELGALKFTSYGQSENGVDVTELVKAGVDDGINWLGFNLRGTEEDHVTYTSYGEKSDRANVRLTVEYKDGTGVIDPIPANVSESASSLVLGTGAICLLAVARRRS